MLKSWEYFEREVAHALDGYRITRTPGLYDSGPDIIVRDLNLVADAKLGHQFLHHELLNEIHAKYCKDGGIPVLVTRMYDSTETCITISLTDFIAIVEELRALRARGSS